MEAPKVCCPKENKKVPIWYCLGSIMQKKESCPYFIELVVNRGEEAKVKCSWEAKQMEKIKPSVVLSPFITTDLKGEIIWNPDVQCPRCQGYMGGEYAGSFQCGFCGYDEYPKYSEEHGMFITLECSWKFLRIFIRRRQLRQLVSNILYNIHSFLLDYYQRGRHRVSIIEGEYMWDWKKKVWFKFM